MWLPRLMSFLFKYLMSRWLLWIVKSINNHFSYSFRSIHHSINDRQSELFDAKNTKTHTSNARTHLFQSFINHRSLLDTHTNEGGKAIDSARNNAEFKFLIYVVFLSHRLSFPNRERERAKYSRSYLLIGVVFINLSVIKWKSLNVII